MIPSTAIPPQSIPCYRSIAAGSLQAVPNLHRSVYSICVRSWISFADRPIIWKVPWPKSRGTNHPSRATIPTYVTRSRAPERIHELVIGPVFLLIEEIRSTRAILASGHLQSTLCLPLHFVRQHSLRALRIMSSKWMFLLRTIVFLIRYTTLNPKSVE